MIRTSKKPTNKSFPPPHRSRWWQPTAVFLPGEFHGQRNLVSYSPRGHKESDMTELLTHRQRNKIFQQRAWQTVAA